jgi:hypothetical protein
MSAFPLSLIPQLLRPPMPDQTFSQPYDQQYHHEFQDKCGYQGYTLSSWRKATPDTPQERIDKRTGFVNIGAHNARDVALPRGSYALAPAECKVLGFSKGGKEKGGWIKLEFYLSDQSGEPKRYFMEISHTDDHQVRRGSVIPKGTVLGTAHFIPRVGMPMLCIRVYDEREKPIDYMKLIGMQTLPATKVATLGPRKALVN